MPEPYNDPVNIPSEIMDKKPTGNKALLVVLCGSAAAVCVQLTQSSEGFLSKAEPDPAGILTGCYGERVDQSNLDPNKLYSQTECGARLRTRLARQYAPPILACLPELKDQRRVKVFGALLDAAYNAGPVAVCNSRMARSIHAGDWAGACNGFLGWYATARDRRTGQRIQLKGLEIRRVKEAALCRQGE